jgi:hypothetical protein
VTSIIIIGAPRSALPSAASIINGGTTVNGVSAPISEYVVAEGIHPY